MTRWLLTALAATLIADAASAQYTIESHNRTVYSNGYLEGPNEFIKTGGVGDNDPDDGPWTGDITFQAGEIDGSLTGQAVHVSDLGAGAGVSGTGGMTSQVTLSALVDVFDEATTFGNVWTNAGINVVFSITEPSEWELRLTGGETDSQFTWGIARLEHFGNPDVFDYDLAATSSFDYDETGTILPGTYELTVAYEVSTELDEQPATGTYDMFFDVTTAATPVESVSWSDVKSNF